MPKRPDPIDALFSLPLPEFVSARKELAARLKKSGDSEAAERVKALAKPPISAWAVNQLYWTQREAFDELIATGQRFRRAQASGKVANMREALEARREALSQLSDLATEILREAGSNASLDTLRRITTTLEALSSFASSSDGPTPGRLTRDIDPPGFDSFGSFVPSAVPAQRAAESQTAARPKKPVSAPSKSKKDASAADRSAQQERQARINAAKGALQDARRSLTAARANARSLEAAKTRAEALAKEAEKQKNQAEDRFKKATAAAADAEQRARDIAAEFSDAAKEVTAAEQSLADATRELEVSFGESTKR